MTDELPLGARVRVRVDVVGRVLETQPPWLVWVEVGDTEMKIPRQYVSVEELPERGASVDPRRDPELPRGSMLLSLTDSGGQRVAYRGDPEPGYDDKWCWRLTGEHGAYSWRQLPGARWQVIEVPADA